MTPEQEIKGLMQQIATVCQRAKLDGSLDKMEESQTFAFSLGEPMDFETGWFGMVRVDLAPTANELFDKANVGGIG